MLLLYRDTWKEEVNEKLKSLDLKMEKILQILDGKQNIVTTKKHPQENVNSTWAKYVEECDRAIIPENVQNILSSKPAIQGMKALTAAKAGKELTPCQFSAAKDLILTAFSIQNGSRPGTVNNATVQNYESARRERQSGKMVILIARHKTAQHGPAMLCMGTQLSEWMSTYVQKIRPQFAIPEEQALFDKADGKAYPDGIGKRITAFYQKAEIRPDIQISSTGIQKMRSTQVHSNEPEAAGAVRRLMAHSEKNCSTELCASKLNKNCSCGT